MTLTLDLLIPKFDVFILAQSPLVVKVWSNSVNKYTRHLANNVRLELKHARTLWKHHAFGYYIGRGIKINGNVTGLLSQTSLESRCNGIWAYCRE